jgi:rare lipoprotein A
MKKLRAYIAISTLLLLEACGGSVITQPDVKVPTAVAKPGAGGYYLDDGPGDNAPADIDGIADATLKTEPLLARANKPYVALGQEYVPFTSYAPYKKQGVASWYGKRYHGKKTSVGEVYDMYAMSGAHTILPLPSYVKVTNPGNGRSVIVRINDRGPFKHDRLIDLSYAAAYKLRLIGQGSGLVEVESIDTSAEALKKLAATKLEPASDPIVTSKPIVPIEGALKVAGFYVQAGAFKTEANSELLQKKIQGLPLAENVAVAKVYNGDLYRVRLGPYASREEADISAALIRKQLNIATIVQNQ